MQKKAGIITHHDVHNHGAHLQLYALSKVMLSLGYDAKALRYTKNYDFYEENISRKYNFSISSIPTYIKYLLEKGVGKTLFNIKKRLVLKQFRTSNNLVGEYYSHAKNLDTVVIGSDEIFSIEPGLNPCFWGMGVPCSKIISYAASCGSTTQEFIEEKGAEEFVRAGTKRINNISVRDNNTKQIIEKYSGISPTIVCDPVILYGYEDEIALASKRSSRKEKYILIYSYDNTMNEKDTIKNIKQYAKENNCKVYSVGFYHKWCDRNINVDPSDIFYWFINSECVITDTFHGAVLSLVTNSELCVKLKVTNKNKLLWLMEEYGLADRVVSDFSEISNVMKKQINYLDVNAILVQKREESLNYLKEALEVND